MFFCFVIYLSGVFVAILVLYLTQWLRFNKDLATGVYHGFVVLCYVMPMFGAILADGYIGKYKLVYCHNINVNYMLMKHLKFEFV